MRSSMQALVRLSGSRLLRRHTGAAVRSLSSFDGGHAALDTPELSTPFYIPRHDYVNYKASNVFHMKNAGSRYVALNRPDALNALDLGMIRELTSIYKDVDSDSLTQLLLLYGASDKAFCAGGDVAQLAKQNPVPLGQKAPQMDFFREEYTLNHMIGTLKTTNQIALLSGVTMGGGVGLSVHGQYRLCTDDTLFAMPETGIGFFPDVGGSWFLPRMERHIGYYLALTGRRLNAMETYTTGLATHYIALGQIPRCLERFMFAEDLSAEGIESVLDEYCEAPNVEDCGEDEILPHIEAIERCFKQPSIGDIRTSLMEETGEHKLWAHNTVTMMDRASPTSLAVTLEQLNRGSHLKTLKECLEMELCIARRFMAGGDFFEGIRAMLIDKDAQPKWQPAPSHDQVLEYFAPLPNGEGSLPDV